jgi:hypothetical protein
VTRIDLVPPEWHAARSIRRKLRKWGGRLGLVILIGGVLYVGLVQLVAAGETDLRRLSSKYSSLQESLAHAEGLLIERERLQRHQEAIGVLSSDYPAVWFLASLGSVLTDDCYLNSIYFQHCSESNQDSEENDCISSVRLLGRAPGHQQVGQTIRRLQAIDQYDEVNLVSIDEPSTADKSREVKFELICTLLLGEGTD